MKIIDSKKDYYDYLVGVYGEDPLIIYDRRNSFLITPGDPSSKIGTIFGLHESSSEKLWYEYSGSSDIDNRSLHLIFEIGLIRVNVIMNVVDNKPKFTIFSQEPISLKKGKGVVSVFKASIIHRNYKKASPNWNYGSELTIPSCNYIWKNTWLPKVVSADTMWQGISAYLGSLKDRPVIDTRSDIQKLESAGFDKKESFRNTK